MKVAPILRAASAAGVESVLVHTGQHYDASMSDSFFTDLSLPAPDFHLGVGSGSHAVQTARVMEAFEPVLLQTKPDWVVVVGDVNSTLAAALVTSKLTAATGSRLTHVEAGLRSGDWTMPEEVNRVVTDRLADRLFLASEEDGTNLVQEGIEESRIHFAGNVMIDTLLALLPRARKSAMIEKLEVERDRYVIVTLHRPSNVDDAARLKGILEGLSSIARELPVVFPMHPRTRRNIRDFRLESMLAGIRVLEPLGYIDMLALVESAATVVTDSGGLQEESTVLGVPCLTVRETTERPATLAGTNRLVHWPPTMEALVSAFHEARSAGRVPVGSKAPKGWDGKASERVIAGLLL
jgi:UDP-N-acetylglucosamine 2-epimerase (non-hydrolysing)